MKRWSTNAAASLDSAAGGANDTSIHAAKARGCRRLTRMPPHDPSLHPEDCATAALVELAFGDLDRHQRRTALEHGLIAVRIMAAQLADSDSRAARSSCRSQGCAQ